MPPRHDDDPGGVSPAVDHPGRILPFKADRLGGMGGAFGQGGGVMGYCPEDTIEDLKEENRELVELLREARDMLEAAEDYLPSGVLTETLNKIRKAI